MAEGHSGALLEIHDALRRRGFEREARSGGYAVYRGDLAGGSPKIPVVVMLQDLDFVEMPLICIEPGWTSGNRLLPHVLGPGRAVCYYTKGAVVLDLYNPVGTLIQCIERAEKVVRNALRGKLDGDFAAEFRSYWLGKLMLVDLPKNYVGPANLYFVKLSDREKDTPVLALESSWALQLPGSRWRRDGVEPMTVVSTEVALSPNPEANWPPSTYSDLLAWLNWLDAALPAKLRQVIASGAAPKCSLAIRAPNGLFAVRLDVPKQLRTEEFLINRRKNLPRQMARLATSIEVERIGGRAADLDYIYARNLESGLKGLVGKRILQIGCGTIGGFLAQQLAQSGASIGGGTFTIVDIDDLAPENLGRHLLGVPHLHRNKAEACAEFLNGMLPGAKVQAIAKDGLEVKTDSYDLVIDTTGEEALSLALNQREVASRPSGTAHLYVWLLGNGAAAQAILTGESGKACLKCLQPDLSGPPRFRGLRPDVSVEIGAIRECSDADFLPFPVSRSVAAAALACDMVLDWANGTPAKRFRSVTFNAKQAFQSGSSSPTALAKCPACRGAH